MRNFSYDSPNPRERRAFAHAERSRLLADLSSATVMARIQYSGQIEAARASLGQAASNLNYVPSDEVWVKLREIDADHARLSCFATNGPAKSQRSGIDAPINTDAVRHGSVGL
ncbi:MAG: hypothetical protein QG623_86 [Patescibacteria group bacterium]|nr:hypothetical protein [Patescibacteria group bacterium]